MWSWIEKKKNYLTKFTPLSFSSCDLIKRRAIDISKLSLQVCLYVRDPNQHCPIGMKNHFRNPLHPIDSPRRTKGRCRRLSTKDSGCVGAVMSSGSRAAKLLLYVEISREDSERGEGDLLFFHLLYLSFTIGKSIVNSNSESISLRENRDIKKLEKKIMVKLWPKQDPIFHPWNKFIPNF